MKLGIGWFTGALTSILNSVIIVNAFNVTNPTYVFLIGFTNGVVFPILGSIIIDKKEKK
jgi:hypothetical protein